MKFNNIGISSELDITRIKHLLKLGLMAAFMVLAGDMILGWGTAEESVNGIPSFLARYLTVSDTRLLLAALLGMIGIPIECLCYFGIYRLIAAKSEKYAHRYRTGIIGCLIFGGCGVHVPCSAVAYFMKKMYVVNPNTAFNETLKFAAYFLLPAMVLFMIFFLYMIITQINAFAKGLTPLPKYCWVFTVLFGMALVVPLKFFNTPFTNALAAGWISLGNIWMFGGLLAATGKITREK